MHPTDGFQPPAWLAGGHRQTFLGYWLRRLLRWTPPTEDLVVEAAESVRLLLRASWQPGPREDHPTLLTVHGLGGSDASAYVLSTGRLAYARGWNVVRMNMRGSGGGLSLCPLLYNAGLDKDLLAAVSALSSLTPRLAVAGFSLGANLVLLMLGRRRPRLPPSLLAAAAVSPPVDLSACAEAIEVPGNGMYLRYFMQMLTETYRQRSRLRPDLFATGRERGLRTLREWDDRITAPFGGYESAAHYYEQSSAGPWLVAIDRPTLMLAANDDPMIPAASVARWPVSPMVRRELLATGGHLGFVCLCHAPGWFWAAERVVAFLEGVLAPSS